MDQSQGVTEFSREHLVEKKHERVSDSGDSGAIQTSRYYVPDVMGQPSRELYRRLDADGLILFTLSADTRRAAYVSWFERHFELIRHPDSDADGITVVEASERALTHASSDGFTADALQLHVDGASQRVPSPILSILITKPADMGGLAILADARAAISSLSASENHLLMSGDAVEIQGTTFPLIDARNRDGQLAIRYREDNVLRPVSVSGNAAIKQFAKALHHIEHRIPLNAGEGYILHNHRWCHGRTAFGGKRVAWRLLGRLHETSDFAFLNRGFRKVMN